MLRGSFLERICVRRRKHKGGEERAIGNDVGGWTESVLGKFAPVCMGLREGEGEERGLGEGGEAMGKGSGEGEGGGEGNRGEGEVKGEWGLCTE